MDEEDFEKKMMERQRKESEIRSLISMLDAPTSKIGDWKVVKIYEARLKGEPDPYNYDELAEERQKVRDRINKLQKEIESE